jgi:DNA-binding SARP family transcriptional activator
VRDIHGELTARGLSFPHQSTDRSLNTFRLRLLGHAALLGSDGAVVSLSSKAIALLAYLRLAAGRRAHRAFLADLLWSEVDEERGRASLRQAVLSIRHHAGDGLLIAEGAYLRLVADMSCDAVEFIDLAARGEGEAAVGIYSAAFFDRFAVPGARGFEHWATVERERLRGAFTQSADAACQQLLDNSRARAALDIALQLVSEDPLRERSWRLLLECRLALGDLSAAHLDVASLQAVQFANSIEIEPATAALISRVARGHSALQGSDEPALRADLVGRTSEFAALLDAWKQLAVHGRVVRMITGGAGVGKTRLLDDLATRLRSLGARVICSGARIGEHGIPYALIASVAERLVALPGAAGVSPDSARTLVRLEPRLRKVYPSAEPDTAHAIDVPLRRATALADLITAVSDERAIALLIDDLHWADDASVRTLAAACTRTNGARMLLVLAQRHVGTAAFEVPELVLDALTSDHIQELVESIAPLPDAQWTSALVPALLRATRGLPLLVMEALNLLTQEALLVHTATTWESPNQDRLVARLVTLDVQRERLMQLDSTMRRVLLRAAVAKSAIDTRILFSATERLDFDDAIRRLVTGGWLVVSGSQTRVQHDEIAQSMRDASSDGDVREAQTSLMNALQSTPLKSDAEWRLEARLTLEAGDLTALSRTIDFWMDANQSARNRRDWRVGATTLLGNLASDKVLRQLSTTRPLAQRLTQAPRSVAIGATIALACISSGFVYRRVNTPVAVRFVTSPLSATSRTMSPVPVVEIVNADGRRVSGATNSVQLRLRAATARVLGGDGRNAERGAVSFPDARILGHESDASDLVIEAVSPGLTSARVKLLTGIDAIVRIDALRVPTTNDVRVNADTVVVRAGSRVQLTADLSYTSPWLASSVMLAGVPTWGDPATTWLELGPIVTPARNARNFTTINFTSPERAGRYRLFLVMAAESDAAHIASGTNWGAGAPRWHDGNDLAQWGHDEAASARRFGFVTLRAGTWVYGSGHSPDRGSHVAAAVIEIVVQDAAADLRSTAVSAHGN